MAFIPKDGGSKRPPADDSRAVPEARLPHPGLLQILPAVVCAGETTDNANRVHHHARVTVRTRTDRWTD